VFSRLKEEGVSENEEKKGVITEPVIKRLKNLPDAPMIDLPDKIKARGMREQIKYLMKLASSLNQACQMIQDERDTAYNFTNKMNEDVKLAIRTKARDREMIHKQMKTDNDRYQKLIEENQRLYAEIKKLENELKEAKDGQHSVGVGGYIDPED
jgi:cell division septum initiation protein DivIVA